jgi:hypothetical protein
MLQLTNDEKRDGSLVNGCQCSLVFSAERAFQVLIEQVQGEEPCKSTSIRWPEPWIDERDCTWLSFRDATAGKLL